MRFYRNGAGRLLRELDQVIAAFLADDLTINGQNVCGKQLIVPERRPRRERQAA
jgi:hypothetical protein